MLYVYIVNKNKYFNSLSIFFFASFFLYYYFSIFLYRTKTFCQKCLCLTVPCILSHVIGEYISPDLFHRNNSFTLHLLKSCSFFCFCFSMCFQEQMMQCNGGNFCNYIFGVCEPHPSHTQAAQCTRRFSGAEQEHSVSKAKAKHNQVWLPNGWVIVMCHASCLP